MNTLIRKLPHIAKYRVQIWIILLVAIAGFGVLLIKETTQYGISLHADSFSYLTASEQLATTGRYGRFSGLGEFRPTTHFPPMYSAAVAVVQKIGLDSYSSARVLNGGLFGMTIFVFGMGIFLITKSVLLSIYGALLTALSPVLMDMFSWAHSEPLYILLSIGFLISLTLFISKPKATPLILSALIAAAAILTRYIGISLILGGLIMLSSRRSRRSRWRNVGTFVSISILPVGLFLIRNILLTGNATNRPAPFWHPPGSEEWSAALNVVMEWIFPSDLIASLPPGASLIVLFTIGVVAYLSYRKSISRESSSNELSRIFILVTLLYSLIYAALVIMTVLFFDTMTLLNQRILSPMLLPFLMLLILLIARRWETSGKVSRVILGFFCLALLGYQTYRSIEALDELSAAPRGYASGIYRNSPTIEYITEAPGRIIYSNDLPALYFWADRMAVYIPSRINPSTLSYDSVEQYQHSLQQMRQRMSQENSLLVIFGPDPQNRIDLAHLSDLTKDLTLIAEFSDGLVFQLLDGN
jgi:hypothetical protein